MPLNTRLIAFIFTCFTLCSCALLPAQNDELAVSFSDPKRMQFQGKGAGAGMALNSTMGPMGIAIGVAIDVGIAKEIETSALVAGFNIDQLVTKVAKQNGFNRLNFLTAEPAKQEQKIHISSYGFKTTGGENDATCAYIQISYQTTNGEKIALNYPTDFYQNLEAAPSYPLDKLKQQGNLTTELIEQALAALFKRVVLER